MILYKTNTKSIKTTYERLNKNTLTYENICKFEKYFDDFNNKKSILDLQYVENPLTRIIDELKSISYVRQITADEEKFYRYKPKLLSFMIYGYIDFWYIILMVNNYHSVYEFKKFKYLYLLNPNRIEMVIDKFIKSEQKMR